MRRAFVVIILIAVSNEMKVIEFSLNKFSDFFVKKVVPTCNLFPKILRCYDSATKTQATKSIFKLTPIHA